MDTTKKRILSIDILRGIIMALMALDHTRDYFHLEAVTQSPTDMETTYPILFFTRWITHFCAPTFVFLSGISIYLQSLRKTNRELAIFLFTRGLWLVFMELTLVLFGWSFDPFFSFIFLQVIWAIGCSMILLSGIILFPHWVAVALGIIITLTHNLVDYFIFPDPEVHAAADFLIMTDFQVYSVGPVQLLSAYAILPWTGIMLMGYAIGKWFNTQHFTPMLRRRRLVSGGLLLITLFILLRLGNSYGDPTQWSEQKDVTYTLLSFLNVTKYPPSLMYACMTLGPAMLALAALENVQLKGFASIMNTFGRVPFFYYLIHIYIIHLLCVALYFIQGFTFAQLFTLPMEFAFRPRENFGFNLGGTYLVWLLVLVLCYFPSRGYDRYKSTHKKWWLGYL